MNLIISNEALGDTVMLLHLIRAFLKQNPDQKLAILTNPRLAPYFKEFEENENFVFIPYDKQEKWKENSELKEVL